MVCFLFITPLATISGWLCLRGAVDHLHFSSRLEAVGLIALTVALFTIYLFWTLVSMAQGLGVRSVGAGSPPAGTGSPLVCSSSHPPGSRQTFKCWRECVNRFTTARECPQRHAPQTSLSSRSQGLHLLGGLAFSFSRLCSSLLPGL